VVGRWNAIDQHTVDAPNINAYKGRLDKSRQQGWVFHGLIS